MTKHAVRTESLALGRRQFVVAAAIAPLLGSALLSGCASGGYGDPGSVWRDFLSDVADLVIPQTDTPSASAINVWAQDVALNAIDVGMDGATYDMLGLVQDHLNEHCGGNYLQAPEQSRYAALEALDASAYDPSPADPPGMPTMPQTPLAVAWRKIKALILLGYYTSEAGASKELRYELVPGHFDPDVPVTPDTRAISSDWFSVSFR